MPEPTIEMRFKITDDGSVVLDKIGGKMKETTGHVEKMSGSLSLIKWDAIVNLGERAYRMGRQVWDATRQTAAWGDEIDRLSKAAGMSTDEFQRWQYVAYRADVSNEQLATGMKILARNMLEATEGKKEYVDMFERVNVSVRDSSGNLKSYTDILGDLADEFSKMPDGPAKVAKALDIFGRSGEALIPLLNQGRAGVAGLHDEFNRLGILIDKETIEKLRKADEEFERFEARLSTLGKKIMAEVVPPLSNMLAVIDQMITTQDIAGMDAHLAYILALKKERAELIAQGKSTLKIEEDIARARERAGFKKEAEAPAIIPGKETIAPLVQSKETATALAKALEKAGEHEMKLNAYFADDAELLKQAAREIERRTKAQDIMEELGIKTKTGAEREIGGIEEQFKLLLGAGFSKEEMAGAKEKMVAQLEAIKAKYSSFSGWMEEEFEEGRVKWIHSIPKDELTKSVEEMANNAIKEIERMQSQFDAMSAKENKIWIDTSEFANANSAIDTLRIKLETMTERSWPVHIAITGSGSSELPIMEKIQEVYSGFNSLPDQLKGLAVDISMKNVNEQIYALENEIARLATVASPFAWRPGAYSKYAIGLLQPQLENLKMTQQALQSYQEQNIQSYGAGAGGVSINIDTVVINGGDKSAALALDQELADLWANNRSQLRLQIQQS